MKKKAFWGTGIWAEVYSNSIEDAVDCYIDNDRSKIGTIYNNRPVVHPSEIKSWKEWSILIPQSYYKAIKDQLLTYGLSENTDFFEWKTNPRCIGLNLDYLLEDYRKTIEQNRKELECISSDRQVILFWAQHTALDLLYDHDFLDNLTDNSNYKVILISAKLKASFGRNDDTEFKKRFTILKMPLIVLHTISVVDTIEDKTINSYIAEHPRLVELSDQLQEEQQNINFNGYRIKAFYIEKYLNFIFDLVKPETIMTQGSVLPLYQMIRDVAIERNIESVFVHPGVIPGTMSLDVDGEVGESLPALYPQKFSRLPINNENITEAKKVIEFCRIRNFNRRIQPDNTLPGEALRRIRDKDKIVFFAGQNDVCSYMYPYNERSKRNYSPIFASSIDAVMYLQNICERNNWGLIYKPHPDYIRDREKEKLSDEVIYAENGNLNELIDRADVVVTILSTTAVNALIKEKPVVMLGYNWLKNSGCTYEAFCDDEIEMKIHQALEKGYTETQKASFVDFVARCLKYYVYDDNKERDLRYGRNTPYRMEDIFLLKNLLLDELTSLES